MLVKIKRENKLSIPKDVYETGEDGISSTLVSSVPFKINYIAQRGDELLCTIIGDATSINDLIEPTNINDVVGFFDLNVGKQVTQDDIEKSYLVDYQRDRYAEYPSVRDQLDDLFKAGVFSAEMTAKIQAVKDKYPKVV